MSKMIKRFVGIFILLIQAILFYFSIFIIINLNPIMLSY